MVVQHQQVELFFLALVMHGGDQHAAGLNAHHGPGRQIGNCQQGFADQLFRLIISMDAAQNDPVCAGAVVQNEL